MIRETPVARRGRLGDDGVGLFGDLVDHERFVIAYTSTLASLHQRGARATLTSLVWGRPRRGPARTRA